MYPHRKLNKQIRLPFSRININDSRLFERHPAPEPSAKRSSPTGQHPTANGQDGQQPTPPTGAWFTWQGKARDRWRTLRRSLAVSRNNLIFELGGSGGCNRTATAALSRRRSARRGQLLSRN